MGLKNKSTRGKKLLKAFAVLFVLFVGLFGYGIYWAFYDMNRLPTGELLTEEISPDGTYTVRTYVTYNSMSDDAVRGELIYNKRNGKSKNIYWNYPESTATIMWIDNSTVDINGHQLKVPKEKFDWRR